MYVTNHRFLDGPVVRRRGRAYDFGWHNVTYQYRFPSVIEGIYSWRTGRNAVSDPPASPPSSRDRESVRTDGFGVHLPDQRGNFIDRLSSRKNYIEEVQRAAFPVENSNGTVSENRVSRTDSGHLFGKVTVFRNPILASYDVNHPSSQVSAGALIYCLPGCWNATPFTYGFSTRTSNLVTPSQRQGIANRFFEATAPDRNEASLGVTVIELLRGDLPTVLRNLKKMIDDYQSIYKTMGSDYLNVVFGWQPLINEIVNVIKVGATIDRLVYYESYRRKRQYDGISRRTDSTTSVNLSGNTGGAYQFAQEVQRTGTGSSALGINVSYSACGLSTLESENYVLTSRYTGLAKPTLRANYHTDKALDIMGKLGLVNDPRLIWDLMPYSWLVDWFTTMGASISNASRYSPKKGKYAVDYAYITTNQTIHETLQLGRRDSSWLDEFSNVRLKNAVSTATSVSRWRDRATPFGFGTRMGNLNVSQFAILTALGLAKGR